MVASPPVDTGYTALASFTGDGVETTYDIPFAYLARHHVKLQKFTGGEWVDQTAWSFNSSEQAVVDVAPGSGESWRIIRRTAVVDDDVTVLIGAGGATIANPPLASYRAQELLDKIQELRADAMLLSGAQAMTGGLQPVIISSASERLALEDSGKVMLIFYSPTSKFQGWDGANWQDLH